MNKPRLYDILIFIALIFATLMPVRAEARLIDEIHITGPFDAKVVVNLDSTSMVRMSTADMDFIVIEYAGEGIYISAAANMPATKRMPITVYCSDNLRLLEVAGRATAACNALTNPEAIAIVASSSASIDANNLTAKQINVSLTGNGSIRLGGYTLASTLNVSLTGSGRISAPSITAERLSITQRGSGKINIEGSASSSSVVVQGSGNVNLRKLIGEKMDLKVYGDGNIYYPSGVQAKLSGKTSNIHAVGPFTND